jgi:hypothetical protein
MSEPSRSRARHILPWIISAALLVYVFGWATDWSKLVEALGRANGPLFLLCASADRLAFFLIWTLLQGAALRRFVVQVPMRSVFAIRGGSELLRAVSNPLSDAAFFLGLGQLTGGRYEGVVAAALVPGVCHFFVMVLQMTLALPFLPGSLAENKDVVIGAATMWAMIVAMFVGVRLSASGRIRLPGAAFVREWIERFPARELLPFFWGFLALSVFDVVIQWLASRAFGIDLGWAALTARLPLVYLSFLVPTLGNFGTREITWAYFFSEFGTKDELIAYAFAVNAVFLVINVLLGVVFLGKALELVREVRRAGREGQDVPHPIFHDPTDQ